MGPSATYVDPFVLDGVEVARGPGSVAYGSDAFGGVIAARTLGCGPGAPLRVEAIGNYGVGIPGGGVGASVSSPLGEAGGIVVAGHYRSYGNWDSSERRGDQLGLPGQRGARARLLCARPGDADGGLAGGLRPRHRPAAEQLGGRAFLLSRGELEPVHALLRQPAGRRLFTHRLRRVHRLLRPDHGPVPLRDPGDGGVARAGRRVGERLPGPRVRGAVLRAGAGRARRGHQRPVRTCTLSTSPPATRTPSRKASTSPSTTPAGRTRPDT